MTSNAVKRLFRDYVTIWESRQIGGLDELIHEHYTGHPSWGDRNRRQLGERIEAFHGLYRNVRFNVEDQIVEGDIVASRLAASAVRAADGRKVKLYGLNISWIFEGKIIEEWMVWEVQDAD